jgi:murein DD-endopeptidase MepM/ murein hydrolase activator NlpD
VRALIAVVALLLLGGAGAALWIRAEGEPPALEAPEALLIGRTGASLAVSLADPRSGLRSLTVELVDGETPRTLLAEEYPGNLLAGGPRREHAAQLALDPKALGALGPDAKLRIAARDWSWRGFFSGNQAEKLLPLRVDLEPPRLDVATGLSYGTRGGAGAVAYTVSEPTAADGVRVGERFYRGYPRPGGTPGQRVAIFALPFDVPPDAKPVVVARDEAGNESVAGWPLVLKEVAQPTASVTLSPAFFDTVLPRLAGGALSADPAASFHEVNTRVRAQNEASIREHLAQSSEQPLFEGGFEQLANSKVTSRFAERRTYFVGGTAVSNAIHYGYDLASTAGAPITAAAAGRVAFTGDMGIYGNCVLVDHGLGVGTLYGHLSSIDVAVGAQVARGQALGRSGSTGLAGGDHLHFAVLVGDTYVDPVEWWDAQWVETHVRDRWQAQPQAAAAN